jgi:arsenate reductase (glutaredoxin)
VTAELTVYEKPTCTTCRNLFALLTERGVDAERIDYQASGLTEDEVRDLVRRTGERGVGDEEAIRLMAKHPELMQRPVVVRGDRAVLARPVERALELLD